MFLDMIPGTIRLATVSSLLGLSLTIAAVSLASAEESYPTITSDSTHYDAIWEECAPPLQRVRFKSGLVLLVSGCGKPSHGASGIVCPPIPAGYPVCLARLMETGKAKEIVSEGGWGGNPYQIRFNHDQSVVITEMIEDVTSKTSYPFLERTVTCTSADCMISAEKCRLSLPESILGPLQQRTAEVTSILKRHGQARKDNGADSLELLDELVSGLTLRVFLGDKKAEQQLRAPPVDLDGAWGEIWAERESNLDTARRAGCSIPRLTGHPEAATAGGRKDVLGRHPRND
jgi:hypothetical protein